MASIKCKACGRRYSYHQSDLCPHCGAYNKPGSRMRVDFDQDGNAELLHEQTFLQQSAAGRQRKDCYERKECHEGAARQVRIPGLNNQQLMEKMKEFGNQTGALFGEKGEKKKGGSEIGYAVIIAVVIMLLLWGDRIFEKCGIGRDEGGDGGKTLEIRGKRRLSARDGGANYQQS